jgi:ferredoxin
VDIGSAYPDVVAPINHQARQDYDYNVYSDAPATTTYRYEWSSGGPQSQRFYRMIGHTGTEDIIDLEPLNHTATVMMGVTNAFSHNLRFGEDVLGGNTSIADQSSSSSQSRLFLAVANDNGTWTDVAQIKMGYRMGTSTHYYTNEKDFAAMAIGPNGTVWVGFHWSGWVEIPGLTSRNSGSGFMVVSWSPTNGWMSADTIGFSTSQYVNLDIAVDTNGDVFFSGACAGTITVHGSQFTGSGSWNICIAQRHAATSSWINLHRSQPYNSASMEAMTDHPNGGVVFWAKSGYYSIPSGGNSYAYDTPGALIRLIPNNSSMWLLGAPTCSSNPCIFIESIDVTPTGDIYLAGHFQYSVSFPNCCSVNSGGGRDGFIAKFNNSGVWDWSIALGGTSNDYIYDINMVGNGSVAVVGKKTGVISVGLTTLSSAGTGFVAMASTLGTWEWAAQPSGSTTVKQVTATGNGTVAAAGQLHYSTASRTFGLDSLNSSDGDDIFLARMSADADADGITDNRDNCQQIYNPSQTNYDGDAQGDICDADDDGEGIADAVDSCPMGALGWTSNNTTDHDTDGCKDDVEDLDDDDDGILDSNDRCGTGTLNWISNGTTDYDTDGCKDSNEDLDDDDDSVNDTADSCPKGSLGWISAPSTDHDGDGCRDSGEDADDDGDGISDEYDSCGRGELNWTSSNITDNDGDGCLDVTEDINDDNDDFFDYEDYCPNGTVGWYSGAITDYDGDGCKDSDEDLDDDSDGVLDVDDNCPKGILGWRTNPTVDFDSDGCHDWNEDTDDDGDGVSDLTDMCSRTPAGASTGTNGCASGEIPDGVGGGGGSVNMSEDNQYENNTYVNNTYVNNTYVNNTYSNETFQNQSFQNNSYSYENETFQNQTFQNNTNLNQTFNEGDLVNGTASDDSLPQSDLEEQGGMTWEPLAVMALMVLLLFINALHLVKKPSIPSGPPDSMTQHHSEFDGIDHTTEVLIAESESSPDEQSAEEFVDEPEQASIENPEEPPTDPPLVVDDPVISDGFEWLEWPEGSGQNHFRPEGTNDEWQRWPVE